MSKDDKSGIKERLLAAGLKLFAEKGFNGSTFRDICEEAGSNIAAINYYFSDKDSFYCAVRDYAREKHRASMRRCWDAYESDPWKALRMQIEGMLDETFDDTMFQVNRLHMRELIDNDSLPQRPPMPNRESNRRIYEERMSKMLSALLGDAATPKNITLLRYTYYSLCLFLPIHKQKEERCNRGTSIFDVSSSIDKKDFADFIINVVHQTVDSMREYNNPKAN